MSLKANIPRRIRAILAVTLILAAAGSARADYFEELFDFSDITVTFSNSWCVNGIVTSGTYDLLAVRITPPGNIDKFEIDGLRNLVDPSTNNPIPGWDYQISTDMLCSVAGPQRAGHRFSLCFQADAETAVEVDVVGFKDGSDTPYVKTHWTWNTSKQWWDMSTDGWAPTRQDVVPVPGAMLLSTLGLAFVAWFRRR